MQKCVSLPSTTGFSQKQVALHTTKKRNLQAAKRLLIKEKKDRRDPYLALLEYRNTSRDKELGSHIQRRLMGRRTKTTLPTSETLLKPKLVKNVTSNLKDKRLAQKNFYDKSARSLPHINAGDDIRIRCGKNWNRDML